MRNSGRTKRKPKNIKVKNERWLIVCEGEKTEPYYFEDLIRYANELSEKKIDSTIRGTGRNTESLVEYTELLESVAVFGKESIINYSKTFVVFDKDSFEAEQFNNAIYKAERMDYIPIWSNECIELWFLLHFSYFNSSVVRGIYFEKLEKIFGDKYDKAARSFPLLMEKGSIKDAYRNAKQLHDNVGEESFAKQNPCTMVFKLINELEASLDINLTK